MKLTDEEFLLGKMCDDLLDCSLELCGKHREKIGDKYKTLRFPERFYDSYVNVIMIFTLIIHVSVITANAYEHGVKRKFLQKIASVSCIELNHLIRCAYNKGYISNKQRDRWQSLTTKIYYKIINWAKSDSKKNKQ